MDRTLVNGALPQGDAERVAALHRYKLLDSPTEESFDNIAYLMADFFSVPIALVSLVDQDAVFFKGNVGMPGVQSTDRSISLCSFAILSTEPTIFDKPLEEPCLLSNPLVHGAFGLRFYAAAPLLTSSGFAIGSVCVIDKKERSFSAKDQEMLVRFATMVMHQIELRLTAINKAEIEQELIQKNKEFKTLVQEAPVAMFVFRGEHMTIDIANEKALAMIQRTDAVVGKPLLEALPELQNTPAYETFQEVYRTGITQHGREVLVPLQKDDILEERWFNFTYTPLYENGQVVGVMDVATEVTDQVMARRRIEEVVLERTHALAKTNQLLEASNKELQRSNANLEEFAHAASHDLKEPVRKITFFTQYLKAQLDPHLDEAALRSFGRIENAAQRMGALIDDLLLYSHVSHRPHETEMVDLNVKVQRVLEDLELDIEEKKAAVAIGKLPTVSGYRRQLQQLFQNLISNALKYSKEDVPPIINISAGAAAEAGRQYNVITVSDNGIGFDQQYADKIFQMFARLHGKSEYSGTGVGLSIVKKVAENHGGFVQVKSAPDKGSVFSIYLPIS